MASNLTTLGTVLLLQGKIAPGKRRLGDAIALVQQFQGDPATARYALAEGMIAAGESSAALELARSIVPADQPADGLVLALEAVALSELGAVRRRSRRSRAPRRPWGRDAPASPFEPGSTRRCEVRRASRAVAARGRRAIW